MPWLAGVVDAGTGRIGRIPYELCVLIAVKDALRRREVYAEGAGRWRDPDEDLPGDFEDNRDVHYAALAKPLDATAFIAELKKKMNAALDRLNTGLAQGTTGGVRVITRAGKPWMGVPKLAKLGRGDLTAQDRDLVPQHQDLRVFGGVAAGEQRQPAEQPNHEQIGEAQEHDCRG